MSRSLDLTNSVHSSGFVQEKGVWFAKLHECGRPTDSRHSCEAQAQHPRAGMQGQSRGENSPVHVDNQQDLTREVSAEVLVDGAGAPVPAREAADPDERVGDVECYDARHGERAEAADAEVFDRDQPLGL